MMRRLLIGLALVTALGGGPAPAYAAGPVSPAPHVTAEAGGAPVWSIGVLLAAIAVISGRALLRKDATWWIDEGGG